MRNFLRHRVVRGSNSSSKFKGGIEGSSFLFLMNSTSWSSKGSPLRFFFTTTIVTDSKSFLKATQFILVLSDGGWRSHFCQKFPKDAQKRKLWPMFFFSKKLPAEQKYLFFSLYNFSKCLPS